jgi:hypothetical protein
MLKFVYLNYLKYLPTIDRRAIPFLRDDWRINDLPQASDKFPIVEETDHTKQVRWDTTPKIRIVERYINIQDGLDDEGNQFEDFELEDDLYEENYHADTEHQAKESSMRSTISIPIPISPIAKDTVEDFDPPFPPRTNTGDTSTRKNRFQRNDNATRDSESINATLEHLGSLGRSGPSSQAASENLAAAREHAARSIRAYQDSLKRRP